MIRLSVIVTLSLQACLAGPEDFRLDRVDMSGHLGPTIESVDPQTGSYGVPQDYPIKVTFSEKIHLPFESVQIFGRQGRIPAAVWLSDDHLTATITGYWPAEESLVLRIDGSAIGESGQPLRDQDPFDDEPLTPFALRFTTGTGTRVEPPIVVSITPTHQEQDVNPAVPPAVCFSKRMKPELVVTRLAAGKNDEELLEVWTRGGTCVELQRSGGLRYGIRYGLSIDAAVDLWGLAMREPVASAFTTRSGPGRLRINEIVTSPVHDWNNSSGGDGIAFSPTPGDGAVTTSDEYIELHNGSAGAVSLKGWRLEQLDGSDQVHVFGEGSSVTERFSHPESTIDAFQPGDYLVIGNPVGDNLDSVTLRLVDGDGFERDSVTLGENGVPSGAAEGAASEAVSRIEAMDSGLAEEDWVKTYASPGFPNQP